MASILPHNSTKYYTLKEHWKKPVTKFYSDNYGYAVNFYQPMIDYLDDRSENRELPHLPFVNERGLNKYRPSNKIKHYSTQDLDNFAREAEDRAKENLRYQIQDFKPNRRAELSVIQAEVNTSKLRKHLKEAETNKSVIEKNIQNRRKIREDMAEKMRIKSAFSISKKLFTEAQKEILKNSMSREELHAAEKISYSPHRHVVREDDYDVNLNGEETIERTLYPIRREIKELDTRSVQLNEYQSKQTAIEIEQLSTRLVEAETKLKTEVARIKKKLQIQITELEMSLDVANKTNIELQKTIKKQSLQLTELQTHYDETQRQLAVTLDQCAIATRKVQSLTAELEELRANYDNALRGKRAVEQAYEDAQARINELQTININLSASRAKLEQELAQFSADYDEVTKELRITDERYQKVTIELKHTIETLHEETERIVKIEAIKKSLEIEVKNLSIRLEEVEANAIVGGKRIISKLEARLRDFELELDEEKRRHAETIKILRKKERQVKEIMVQVEEDQTQIQALSDSLDKVNQKVNIYKRQLQEQEGLSSQSVTRVRRFQRELEAAEDRADVAENNLSLIRAKHRTFVTTSSVPGSQVYLVQETRTSSHEV